MSKSPNKATMVTRHKYAELNTRQLRKNKASKLKIAEIAQMLRRPCKYDDKHASTSSKVEKSPPKSSPPKNSPVKTLPAKLVSVKTYKGPKTKESSRSPEKIPVHGLKIQNMPSPLSQKSRPIHTHTNIPVQKDENPDKPTPGKEKDPDRPTKHPDRPTSVKLKRKTKVVLKPRHELKLVGSKRKVAVPRKGQTTSSEETPHKRPKRTPSPSMEDMISEMEDRGLSEEDWLEILTCESPVWWEDPPEHCEDAISAQSPNQMERDPETFPEVHLLEKLKTDKHTQTELKLVILSDEKQRDTKFMTKRSKLENLLGNLKSKVNIDKKHESERKVKTKKHTDELTSNKSLFQTFKSARKVVKSIKIKSNDKPTNADGNNDQYRNREINKRIKQEPLSLDDRNIEVPTVDVLGKKSDNVRPEIIKRIKLEHTALQHERNPNCNEDTSIIDDSKSTSDQTSPTIDEFIKTEQPLLLDERNLNLNEDSPVVLDDSPKSTEPDSVKLQTIEDVLKLEPLSLETNLDLNLDSPNIIDDLSPNSSEDVDISPTNTQSQEISRIHTKNDAQSKATEEEKRISESTEEDDVFLILEDDDLLPHDFENIDIPIQKVKEDNHDTEIKNQRTQNDGNTPKIKQASTSNLCKKKNLDSRKSFEPKSYFEDVDRQTNLVKLRNTINAHDTVNDSRKNTLNVKVNNIEDVINTHNVTNRNGIQKLTITSIEKASSSEDNISILSQDFDSLSDTCLELCQEDNISAKSNYSVDKLNKDVSIKKYKNPAEVSIDNGTEKDKREKNIDQLKFSGLNKAKDCLTVYKIINGNDFEDDVEIYTIAKVNNTDVANLSNGKVAQDSEKITNENTVAKKTNSCEGKTDSDKGQSSIDESGNVNIATKDVDSLCNVKVSLVKSTDLKKIVSCEGIPRKPSEPSGKSILISDKNFVKYCLKCSCIFESETCSYCDKKVLN